MGAYFSIYSYNRPNKIYKIKLQTFAQSTMYTNHIFHIREHFICKYICFILICNLYVKRYGRLVLKLLYSAHTVGPQYRFDKSPKKLLESAYTNSFLLADNYKCQSIAFPSIATGVYAYPKEEATKIAYKTISDLFTKAKYMKDVVFVFYSDEDANIFKKLNNFEY